MANYSQRLPGFAHQGFFYPEPPFTNGYETDASKPYARVRWKCQAFVNKTRYIGNVYLTTEGAESVAKSERFPDSVFKSDVDALDTFRPYRRIDVATGDGEDIVALAIYADRLLEFKQNTLYVINIQGDSEFLEATFKFKGVQNPQAVCETDFGVAWVNKEGCYLYTGSGGVQNLLERDGRRLLALSNDTLPAQTSGEPWDTHITDQSAIGYSPLHRKLFVRKAIGAGAASTYATTNANLYIFDVASGSWTFHLANSTDDPVNDCSDYFVDMNKDMVFWEEETANTYAFIKKWADDPKDQDDIKFWTKNYDFGDPYIDKRIYKVSVRHKGGNAMPVFFSLDGGETETALGTLSNSSTAHWSEMTTNLPITANQFMLGFNQGTAVQPTTYFELYEINIIYRKLKTKSL